MPHHLSQIPGLQEIANTPTEILGPAGPATPLAVEELQTDISGTWSSRVTFVDESPTLEIQQNGPNISGGYHFGDDILGFTGQRQPVEKG